ncbi:hypothetical protein STPYR_12507 [uncultured Stenotrophomonas sp.]|uniref:Uncharacterized protein n=1 Tax=uncultured Stenotrophomonas sp. TaxID=165438 RepID=A0A1Y5Q5R1_9GAMM|nr:hypothetical protein STPYR_12507 [uncultured Stenotrophomonas sp.]
MDEKSLHRLRNDLNVVTVGVALLKRQLEDQASSDALDSLRRIEQAALRCTALVMAGDPRPHD